MSAASTSSATRPRRGDPGVRNLRLLLAYDGTDFRGWQRQAHGVTIQSALEEALAQITRRPLAEVLVSGSGRTDAGVHAVGQVASVLTRSAIRPHALLRGMNAILPMGIVVRAVTEAPLDFHARYSARGKVYRYTLFCSEAPPLADRRLVHWWRHPLDLDLMEKGAALLVGRHDFAAFTTQANRISDTVRDLWRVQVEVDGEKVHLIFASTGFLYNMVRAMTGTLIEIGCKRRPPEDITRILLSRTRRLAGENAPACGLSLLKVIYDHD